MSILVIIGWVLSLSTSLFLGKSALDKIYGTDEMIESFHYMKLESYRTLTGYGELFGVILLLIPFTSLFGVILIVSFMSAAAVMHLSLMEGVKVHIPILIGMGALIGHFLRVL